MGSEICKQCKKKIPIEKRTRNAIYCTKTCYKAFLRQRYENGCTYFGVSSGTVGAIQELKVGADLLTKGFEVFRAMSPSCSCDLVVLINKKLIRIEVTTARKGPSGRVYHPTKVKEKFDILALVYGEGIIEYHPSLEEIDVSNQN